MSVHYKFKTTLDFATVTFDGIHISVSDLKKEIYEQKRLAKNADFDLQIQNAQSKEVYEDETALIPKNTSVIVARVPIADQKKKSQNYSGGGGGPGGGPRDGRFALQQRNHLASLPPSSSAKEIDLASMDGTEEEKIKAMMSQSTADYDPSRYMKIRGANQHGRVPELYRCFKCNKTGHWIKNCPHDDVKKSTGIPRSFMVVVDGPEVPGALMTPEGQYAVPAIDHEAYLGKNKPQAEPTPKPKIPEELICPLCQDLLTDALLVPCCANSYCDECIRSALLESEDQECPGCHEKETSPNELIPNRFLRSAVNAFKNETGYSKPAKMPEKSPHKEAQAAAAESRKVSMDELPEDLFPHSPRKVDTETEVNDNSDSAKNETDDLYDFNDGSIPSPFAKQEESHPHSSRPNYETRSNDYDRGQKYGGQYQGEGQGNHRDRDRDYHRNPPPHYRGGPPQYGQGPPGGMRPSHQHSSEPPPPGFDLLPPGEERPHMQPSRHQHSGPPPMNSRDGRPGRDGMMGPGPGHHPQQHGHGPPMGHPNAPPGHGPPMMQMPGPPGSGPFNPMQPPPGYPPGMPPPGSMHPRGPMPGHGPGPPPGAFPHQFPPANFNRLPPPGDPMLQQGPYPMDDRQRDEYNRNRMPPRRSFNRDRERRPPGDENRPGAIDDPLKEFERIMREKDRRKQMSSSLKKRSKSRSMSPTVRRSQSPYGKRSPSYPRSPSPKRKRVVLPSKRRSSFSRSRSRTPPPPPPRRAPRSRSRSRNRSMSPHYAKRRSPAPVPRRAPPCSPSPPPSRYYKKEKEEFFDHHSRYDDRERERERERERSSSSRYSSKHHPRDFENKVEEDYKYQQQQDRYGSPGMGRHDSHHGGRPDFKPPSRSYQGQGSSHRGPTSGFGHEQPPPTVSERDRTKPSENRRLYSYEPTTCPPGIDQSGTNLLSFIPPSATKSDVYAPVKSSNANVASEKSAYDKKSEPELKKNVPEKITAIVAEKKETKEHRRRKSSEEKKMKKEKKKQKKDKKEKDKKDKKHKKGKEGETEIPEVALSEAVVPLLLPAQVSENLETLTPPLDKLVETKLTAPCDSTVKSPDRLATEAKPLLNPNLLSIENPYISDRGVVMTDLTKPSTVTLSTDFLFDTNVIVADEQESKKPEIQNLVPMPASKWDKFDSMEDITAPTAPNFASGSPKTDSKLDIKESKLPPEVLRRAENVIRDKPITVQTISVSVTAIEDGKSKGSPTQVKKITITDIGTLPAEYSQDLERGNRNKDSDGEGRNSGSKSTVSSAVVRRSVKERLGSKVSEDEAVQPRLKEEETRYTSSRSRRSPLREREPKADRDRDRDRDRERELERERERERDRETERERERERDRERDREKEREREAERERDRERERYNRSKRSRSRSRSPKSRQKQQERERPRSPPRREKEKERIPDLRSLDIRMPERLERDRPSKRSRSRSREDQRGYRRHRSPVRPGRGKSPLELASYPRKPHDRPQDSRSRHDSIEGRSRRATGQDDREPSPPGVSDKPAISFHSKHDKESKSRSSDAGGVAAAFTNEYAELSARKAKQRINIKLSSTAKVEKESSSSSDEHEVNSEIPIPKHSVEENQSKISPEPGTKKRKKKRQSSATSSTSSSSSSDGKHKKKKKKSKKKKKKKKKSK